MNNNRRFNVNSFIVYYIIYLSLEPFYEQRKKKKLKRKTKMVSSVKMKNFSKI